MTEAFLWYKKGAESGDTYSQYQLARMFCEGQGISQPDAASCYAWLLAIVDKKDPVYNVLAQHSLSLVQSQATQEEIKRGNDLYSQIEKKLPTESKKKDNNGFNLF